MGGREREKRSVKERRRRRKGNAAARWQALAQPHLLNKGEQAGKGDVHALDRVGQLQKLLALLRQLLNVVAWAGRVANLEHACKAVEAVANGNVDGLAKDPVALAGVRNDLRVAAADVEHLCGEGVRPLRGGVGDACVCGNIR